MTTANPRTDETGNAVRNDGGFHSSNVPLYAHRKDPWKQKIIFNNFVRLQQLLSNQAYTLLANYLINEEKYSPLERILYGKSGMTRAIKIKGKEYRSNAYRIYTKNSDE